MTIAYHPTAPGAAAPARKPAISRIHGMPLAVFGVVGAAVLAVAGLGVRGSTERALAERLNELSAQVRALEQTVRANEQKAGPPDALKALQVQQVQTDALVATLAKEVEALRGSRRPVSPPPGPESRARTKAAR